MKSIKSLIVVAAVILLSTVTPVLAQSPVKRANGRQKSAQGQAAASPEKAKDSFIKATEDYKAGLNSLLASYQDNVEQLTQQAGKLKELYDQGIISKRDLEESQNLIAEARVKVDDTRKQIAAADLQIAEAQKPPAGPPGTLFTQAEGRAPLWTTGDPGIDALIRQNGARYGVDPYLIYCVMEQESHFNPSSVSPKGAGGLMQLMPDTAARFGVVNIFDAAQNIMGGTRYLKELLQMFGGRVDLTLASYNAGEGAVLKYGQRVPPYKETQDYVRLISARYQGSGKYVKKT